LSYDPFISIDDLYAYLRLPALGVGQDDPLAVIALDSACYMIRDFLHQTINLVAGDIIAIDSDGTDTLMLPEAPVIAVTDVQRISLPLWVTDDIASTINTTLDPSTYIIDYDKGLLALRAGARWPNDRGGVQVTYTHGWSVIPTSIRIVALTAAARIYDQGLAKAETIGNIRLVYSHDESLGLSAREKDMLVKYRRSGTPRYYTVTT
jgi:hypothetical protein